MKRNFLIIFFLLSVSLKAQIPQFLEDFGFSPPQIGPSLPVGVTTFSYNNLSQTALSDGEYTIATNPNLGRQEWHNVQDVSYLLSGGTQTGGKMLLVNAAFEPFKFYERKISGLCSNTEYRFSAYIMNVTPDVCNNQIPVNVTFEVWDVNGSLINSVSTGPISYQVVGTSIQNLWQQYGFNFTTDESELILIMRNNGVGGCGNDLAIDNIRFSASSEGKVSFENDVGITFQACKNTPFTLNAELTNENIFPSKFYQWQESRDNGNTWNNMAGENTSSLVIFAINQKVMYRYKVGSSQNELNSDCFIFSKEITVTYDTLQAIAKKTTVCEGDSINLFASGGITYQWTGPDGFFSNEQNPIIPEATEQMKGNYTVTTIKSGGCQETVFVNIDVLTLASEALTADKNEIYEGETVILKASGGNRYQWSTGDTTSFISVSPSQTTIYKVLISDNTGCAVKSIEIKVLPWEVYLRNDTLICDKEATLLSVAEIDVAKYKWSTGDTTASILVSENGTYTLTVTIGNLIKKDSITITYSDLTFDVPPFKGCITFVDVIAVNGKPPYSYSLDGITYQDGSRFLNIESGLYTLYVKDANGCVRDTVAQINSIKIPNYFSPNNDNINDTWKLDDLEYCPNAIITIFDRYGRQIKLMKIDEEWDGIYLNKSLSSDTYWYVIEFNDDINHPIKGNITIKRK